MAFSSVPEILEELELDKSRKYKIKDLWSGKNIQLDKGTLKPTFLFSKMNPSNCKQFTLG